nr:IS1595 family transposase [Rhodococcus sp. (in: high G+C Gram-positive bacteria)]
MPRGGSDYPRTYQEFREWFPDDASCVEYLADLRWPEGFVCPACGGIESWRTAKGLWMCVACGRKTSVTAGTIFHRSRTPLSTWFAAAWFITSQKNGVSALTVQRMFGFGSYETAWAWLQKFRRAMVRPDRDQLGGPDLIVELDETFVGGISTGHPGASSEKLAIMVAVERVSARKLGRVRFRLSDAPGTLKLLDFATDTIVPGTLIRTDGARFLRKLPDLGYRHEYSNGYESEDRSQELPGVHMVASLFKRWVAGTLHHKISEKHMPYYLDEYAFRFNRRTSAARGMLFYRLLQQSVNTDPHPLSELTAE